MMKNMTTALFLTIYWFRSSLVHAYGVGLFMRSLRSTFWAGSLDYYAFKPAMPCLRSRFLIKCF